MRQVIGALAMVALACGGQEAPREGAARVDTTPGRAPAEAAPTTGTVHEVRMELRGGQYIYDPAQLTISVGDRVRWINISGLPHNVSFYPDQIPAGAADFLQSAMPRQMSPLNGEIMTDTLATYEISFAGAPVGTYGYFCLPHEAMGMKAMLTVQQ